MVLIRDRVVKTPNNLSKFYSIVSEWDCETGRTAGNYGGQWSWEIYPPECPHFQKLGWFRGDSHLE